MDKLERTLQQQYPYDPLLYGAEILEKAQQKIKKRKTAFNLFLFATAAIAALIIVCCIINFQLEGACIFILTSAITWEFLEFMFFVHGMYQKVVNWFRKTLKAEYVAVLAEELSNRHQQQVVLNQSVFNLYRQVPYLLPTNADFSSGWCGFQEGDKTYSNIVQRAILESNSLYRERGDTIVFNGFIYQTTASVRPDYFLQITSTRESSVLGKHVESSSFTCDHHLEDKIETGDVAFDNIFEVRSPDRQETFRILTPLVTTQLVQWRQQFRHFNIIICNQKLFFALHNGSYLIGSTLDDPRHHVTMSDIYYDLDRLEGLDKALQIFQKQKVSSQ